MAHFGWARPSCRNESKTTFHTKRVGRGQKKRPCHSPIPAAVVTAIQPSSQHPCSPGSQLPPPPLTKEPWCEVLGDAGCYNPNLEQAAAGDHCPNQHTINRTAH